MQIPVEHIVLTPGQGAGLASMTFPAYSHLLALHPARRLLGEPGPLVQPLAVVARLAGVPVGLALAETPLEAPGNPELLSLFVRQESRGWGLAAPLLGRLEEELRARGFSRLEAVWMTGKSGIERLERVLARRGWSPPELRTVTLRFTPDEAAATPWYRRQRLAAGFEIFSWSDLTAAEREELQSSQARSPWIAPDLVPWRFDRNGFEPLSSVGLRHHGKVVGWVINHRIAPDLVRFTCSYIRKDLGRRAKILPLYVSSIERLRQLPKVSCTFVTPVQHPTMVRFVGRWCAPWAGFVGETRGAAKMLEGES